MNNIMHQGTMINVCFFMSCALVTRGERKEKKEGLVRQEQVSWII